MEHFDLKTYLRRINYSGSTAPTLATLNGLTEAHTRTIPFENIDVILNRKILLSDDALFQKLVVDVRGGYCFEQNGLFLRALSDLGFQAKPISARVRLRFTTRSEVAPRTHVFLRVEIGNESFLTDVGMGAGSLTKALVLRTDEEQKTPHDTRRLCKEGALWYHQIRYGEVWQDACEFTLEEMPLIDREVANWYTSTHPQSHFRDKLVAARALENGSRISLQNDEFTIRKSSGEAEKKKLQSHDEIINVLTSDFGIRLSSDDREHLKFVDLFKGL
ncbi:MAG: arylamine N-acetyltransferase family protein [Bacteriovoracaceae bacterium]